MRLRFRVVSFLLLWFACLGQVIAQDAKPISDLKPTVILISLDGFRWDYPDKYPTPNLHALIKNGVRAEMIPSFPTKTFPNHYTIVTGLYPDHHGIVANNMWDDAIGKKFTMSTREQVQDRRWWGGEPIWVTAEKQGQKTAPLYWPGSEAAIEEVRPSYWEEFRGEDDGEKATSHEYRVAKLLSWLDKPVTDRPTFLTLYFEDVDTAEHDFGVGTPEVEAAVAKEDTTIGKLMEALRARGIADQVNIVVVADHGHANNPNKLFLEEYLDLDTLNIVDWSPVLAVTPKRGAVQEAYERLKTVPHMSVYLKQDLPKRLHYGTNPRVPPIIGIADEGWEITTKKRLAGRKKGPEKSTHGYDNALRSMHAIFIAHGPAWKKAKTIKPFENVNVYEAMCFILALKPAKNDGALDVLSPYLVRRVASASAK